MMPCSPALFVLLLPLLIAYCEAVDSNNAKFVEYQVKDFNNITTPKVMQVCPPCLLETGDQRCKQNEFNVTALNQAASQGADCLCGCQTCPDLQKYKSTESDFCLATPKKEGECAEDLYPVEPLFITCLFACPLDQRCTSLPYDRSRQACGCECQCPNGKFYMMTSNFDEGTPIDESECPHKKYPLPVPNDVCSLGENPQ